MDKRIRQVLSFWFSGRVQPRWFNSTPEFDAELRSDFSEIYRVAKSGELDDWQNDPQGALALIIILDQFPLNMFRGQAEGFSCETKAQRVSHYAIDNGFDTDLTDTQKVFMYMPLMHSEDMADQDEAVSLFERAGLEDNLRYAKHHRAIVRRFGRFPHRNAVLGRKSSAEELDYLASDEAFTG